MVAKIAAALAVLTAGAALAQDQSDPLTRPIAAERAQEWLAPRAPVRVFANTYLVGFAGLSVALIDTGEGLILIDGALPQAVPTILANVASLGFRSRDIKYILSTEPHGDHAGGLAALARETGATVIASLRGAEGLRSGRLAADDPQHAYDHRFPPVPTVRVVRDQEKLRLGNVVVTAHATPGHTMGSMSWSWRSCASRRCRTIVFASSLNPVSADGFRYTATSSRAIVRGFRRSHAAMGRMPCDILIAAHPGQEGFTRAPGACRAYASKSKRALITSFAEESKM
jgi:metallo-beta-lactamase class B